MGQLRLCACADKGVNNRAITKRNRKRFIIYLQIFVWFFFVKVIEIFIRHYHLFEREVAIIFFFDLFRLLLGALKKYFGCYFFLNEIECFMEKFLCGLIILVMSSSKQLRHMEPCILVVHHWI